MQVLFSRVFFRAPKVGGGNQGNRGREADGSGGIGDSKPVGRARSRRGSCLFDVRAENLVDGGKQFVVVDRFLEKGGRPGGQRAVLVFCGVTSGNNDHRCGLYLIHPAEPLDHPKAVPRNSATVPDIRWKADVQQDQVGPLPPNHAQGLRAIQRGDHLIIVRCQLHRKRLEDHFVVIHD